MRVRLWLARNERAALRERLNAYRKPLEQAADMIAEGAQLAYVRACFALDEFAAGLPLVQRIYAAATAGRRTAMQVETLALQSLGYAGLRDLAAAQPTLERTLLLAAPQAYLRMFLDEGDPMKSFSYATVKKHSNNLFAKLGVSHRAAAIARARELRFIK